ncbi:AcrR family transcriptional regulator [Actinoplanes lutulentus]|nr:TetR family transcriptional regulator [Actinoplanes lutulentus]MBB2948767.1 AcrR family transcriptional regulator [Actinoplanes lutulentus]
MVEKTRLRSVAREAIRADLAKVALAVFTERGFDNVSAADVAEAAGVSRSTFLRYFATKEEAVLSSLDPLGDTVAAALTARPAGEDLWTALRRCLEPLIDQYRDEPAVALSLAKLVDQSSSLTSARLDKQARWRRVLAGAVADRLEARDGTDPRPALLAGAALTAFEVATARWISSDGTAVLPDLVDEAFAYLTPAGAR